MKASRLISGKFYTVMRGGRSNTRDTMFYTGRQGKMYSFMFFPIDKRGGQALTTAQVAARVEKYVKPYARAASAGRSLSRPSTGGL